MTSQRIARFGIVFLVATGLLLGAVRWSARRAAPSARGEVWRLNCRVQATPERKGAMVRLALPNETGRARLLAQSFSHPGFSLEVLRGRSGGKPEAVAVAWSGERALVLEADFDVEVRLSEGGSAERKKVKLTADARAALLREEPGIEVRAPAIVSQAMDLVPEGTSRLTGIRDLFDFCAERIAWHPEGASGALDTLTEAGGDALGKARLMTALCRACRLPARVVTGVVLDGPGAQIPHHWVEVYVKGEWRPYDPSHGYAEDLPATFLAMRRGGARLVHATACREVRSSLRLSRVPPGEYGNAKARGWGRAFDLTRLSLGMRETLALVLLLPLGALITSLARNVIGVQTYGTFTPALLALTFVYADWRVGLGVLLIVFAVGLAGRWGLERMKLLLVPRLSVILTLVVLMVALSLSVLHELHLAPTARSVVLPLVILTMMIERFHMHWEEDSAVGAMKLLAGTCAVAAACYGVLRWEWLGRQLVEWPEALLLVAAALVALGRYSGYRLSEWLRFRDFAGGGGDRQ